MPIKLRKIITSRIKNAILSLYSFSAFEQLAKELNLYKIEVKEIYDRKEN